MGHLNCNMIDRKGKHLTYEERIKLEALSMMKLTLSQIGEQLSGRCPRTIKRELKKGMVKQLNSNLTEKFVYSAALGQQKHDDRATAKGPPLKIAKDHDLVKYLENAIGTEKKSPYAAIQYIANNGLKFRTSLCVKTVYNYLDNNLFLNISNKNLTVKKGLKKRNYDKVRPAYNNVKGTSISERPKEIDDREEPGHWEMDTVVGKQGTKTVLLVLSERMSRKELIFKIPSKSQFEVVHVMDKLERKHGKSFCTIFQTITCDNGCENLDFDGIEKSIMRTEKRTKVYYAHPFSSWERGTNENINKMIRRFIPKGEDISIYTKKQVKQIQHWINNYPRKILGGLSANMIAEKWMVA